MIAAQGARRKWYKEEEDFIIAPPYHDFSLDLSLPSQGEHFGPPAPGLGTSRTYPRSGGLRRTSHTYKKFIEGGPSLRKASMTQEIPVAEVEPSETCLTRIPHESVYFSLPYGAPSGGQFFGPPDTGGPSGGGGRGYGRDPAYPGGPQGQAPQQWRPGMGGPHQWDNAPGAPPPDNPNAAAQPPPNMNMGNFQQIQGYGNVGGFGQMAPMPPPPPPPPPQGDPPHMKFDSVANLSEDECRQAMLEFVAENCCYGKKPAQEMSINNIQPSTALHYILETFCEGRQTGYVHEPYRGQPIDGPQNGMPPPPWALPCQPDGQFRDHDKLMEVPHTAQVKPCHHCNGRGFNRCHRCQGCGWNRCGHCGGDGRTMQTDAEGGQRQVPCGMCGGDGKRSCFTCGGDGRITCTTCDGYQQLKCYIRLTVSYKNHQSDYIMENTDMPDELVRQVSGAVIFEQTMLPVWPIVAYPLREVNDNSVRLTQEHRNAFTSEKYLNQRHSLRAVPVTEVAYKWDDASKRYWVFGQERKVHSPDYPQQCCWGCEIL